jgi:large subunit ribosomal protein L1
MGQKRIRVLDLSEKEEKTPKKKEKPVEKKEVKPSKKAKAKKPEKKKVKKEKARSKRYKRIKKGIKRDQFYLAKKALSLVIKNANVKFDESVDIDITVKKEGLTGSVKLPHGTGKKIKIAIFDKKVEEQIKKGKLGFDLLIAKPADMSKVARYARILGPKGLMPNPKNKTISDDPKKTVKNLSGGEIHFKTEKKAPLIHINLGKISFGEKKLLENLKALIKKINPRQIKKAIISSTMGPGIKLKIE